MPPVPAQIGVGAGLSRRADLTDEAMALADSLGEDLVLSVDAVRAFQDRLHGYMGAAKALATGGTPAEA